MSESTREYNEVTGYLAEIGASICGLLALLPSPVVLALTGTLAESAESMRHAAEELAEQANSGLVAQLTPLAVEHWLASVRLILAYGLNRDGELLKSAQFCMQMAYAETVRAVEAITDQKRGTEG